MVNASFIEGTPQKSKRTSLSSYYERCWSGTAEEEERKKRQRLKSEKNEEKRLLQRRRKHAALLWKQVREKNRAEELQESDSSSSTEDEGELQQKKSRKTVSFKKRNQSTSSDEDEGELQQKKNRKTVPFKKRNQSTSSDEDEGELQQKKSRKTVPFKKQNQSTSSDEDEGELQQKKSRKTVPFKKQNQSTSSDEDEGELQQKKSRKTVSFKKRNQSTSSDEDEGELQQKKSRKTVPFKKRNQSTSSDEDEGELQQKKSRKTVPFKKRNQSTSSDEDAGELQQKKSRKTVPFKKQNQSKSNDKDEGELQQKKSRKTVSFKKRNQSGNSDADEGELERKFKKKNRKTVLLKKQSESVYSTDSDSDSAAQIRRLAEFSAELDYKFVPKQTKKKKTKERYIHYNKYILKALKEKRKDKKKVKKFNDLMVQYLGDSDAVTMFYENQRRVYVYVCPKCGESIREKLSRHLNLLHEVDKEEANMLQSKMRVLFLWCRANKHNTCHPAPCKQCNEWHLRIDHHFKNKKKHPELTDTLIKKEVLEAKQASWISLKKCPEKSYLDNPHEINQGDSIEEERGEKDHEEEKDFVYRSKPKITNRACEIDYLPEGALKLTKNHRKLYNISEDDFFTIYYEDAETFLEAFYDSRMSSGDTHENAVQHRNKVEGIWNTMNPEMTLFPINALSNLHLFRDFYHVPNFKLIGKSGGVQAGTLRSRYTSLTFFIAFLRKRQIFAGLTRNQLINLEKAVDDFNKELNPHIKQRTIDVRRNKSRHLLTSSHFIAYGRSDFVQDLLRPYFEYNKTQKLNKQYVTKQYAIRFHDYLIAALTIGNGLRASNIIELKVRDVEEAAVDENYPGHRIITNATYKTSTIYGEKFIVVPVQLFNQLLFYLKFIRPTLVIGKRSSYLFVPSSDDAPKCNQTNISAKLTSTFGLANVFKKDEYTRVSCTRIRCAIATFACNEGGYETAFFARHFMKNREETTSRHYNLLSNRRHALNIAMKLYENFTDIDGKELPVDVEDVNELTNIISGKKKPSKKEVLDWVKENNIDLSEKEMADIKSILCEDDPKQHSTCSFYSKQDQESSKKKRKINSKIDFDIGYVCPDKHVTNKDTIETKGTEEPDAINAENNTDNVIEIDNKCRKRKHVTNKDTIETKGTEEPDAINAENNTDNVIEIDNKCRKRKHVTNKDTIETKDTEEPDAINAENNTDNVIEIDNKCSKRKVKNIPVEYPKTGHPRKFIPMKYPKTGHPRKFIPVKYKNFAVGLVPRKFIPSIVSSIKYPKRRQKLNNNVSPQDIARMYCSTSDPASGFLKKKIDERIGYGIFVLKDFEKDSFLLTYKGSLTTAANGDELENHYANIGAGCYLYFFQHGKETLCVDATETEGFCKYVNDCPRSNANCYMDVVVKDDTPFLCLFSSQYIAAGTELRYDYGDSEKKMWWRKDERYNKPLTIEVIENGIYGSEKELINHTPGPNEDLPTDLASQAVDSAVDEVSECESSDCWRPSGPSEPSDAECQSEGFSTPRKMKTNKVRQRKGKFDSPTIKIIRSRCRDIIEGKTASKSNIEKALQYTSILGKFTWKQIRSRISYERQ